MQQALGKASGEEAKVVGSGRTDAGVHALGQVASLSLDRWRASAEDLMRAINRFLPDTVVVLACRETPVDFHAIRDAIGKRYRYQLQIAGTRDAFSFRYRWHVQAALDLNGLREAAARLVGRYDCASFQASGSAPKQTTVRNVTDCQLIDQGRGTGGGTLLAIEVAADGFLYNMVRNIVGTLVEVGRGKQPPAWVDEVVAAKDRTVAGPTAPAHGLFLVEVDYGSISAVAD